MKKPGVVYHGSQYLFDIVKPQQAHGTCEAEAQMGIYCLLGRRCIRANSSDSCERRIKGDLWTHIGYIEKLIDRIK